MEEQEQKKFDSSKITGRELQKYERQYSEAGLMQKLTKYGRIIGMEALFKALQLWYVMQKPEVPASTKAVIMGALGYLIAPLDFVADVVPLLGYTDDMAAIAFALLKVQGYIDDEVDEKARRLLGKIFGEDAAAGLK